MIGIFLDTETNGLDPYIHTMTELAIELIDLSNGYPLDEYTTTFQLTPDQFSQSDPCSLSYTGITFEKLQTGKPISKIQQEVLDFFHSHHLVRDRAIFICQNPSFDRIFFSQLISSKLQEQQQFPYRWLDLASMYWANALGSGVPIEMIHLSKDDIAQQFGLPPEAKPHRAIGGVRHLIECYKRVVGFRL